MKASHTSTSNNYMRNHIRDQVSVTSKELTTGKRTVFRNPTDIIVGEMNNINRMMYNSATPGLESVTTLLNTSNQYVQEMSTTLESLTTLLNQASTQNLSRNALSALDAKFQTQLRSLEQIATNASIGSINPLNGSISAATPLNIYTPTGDAISITIPNMKNEASPIGMPQPGDLQIEFPMTIDTFLDNVIVTDPTDRIKEFCGQNSFLYILANQMNPAFAAAQAAHDPLTLNSAHTACMNYLNNVDWDNLLSPADCITVRTLIADRRFNSTIPLEAGGRPGAVQRAIIGLIRYPNPYSPTACAFATTRLIIGNELIPDKYFVQASNMLSISSPSYFQVVEQRLQSAKTYLASAQNSINRQTHLVNGLKARYAAAEDLYGENADKYLKTDMIESTVRLRTLATSQSSVIQATVGFHAKLNKTIADTMMNILRKH